MIQQEEQPIDIVPPEKIAFRISSKIWWVDYKWKNYQ
jgi:hypothetical protein